MVFNPMTTEFSRGGPFKESLTRRDLLALFGGLALGAGCRGPWARSPRGGARFQGFPVGRLDSFLTPTADFFVRDHFGVPPVALGNAAAWIVSIEGEVERPFQLRVSELRAAGQSTLPATLECAGNAGRNGVNWAGANRAWSGASTAAWEGVSVASLLHRAGLRSSAREIVFEGADTGFERGVADRLRFARSVPVAVALRPSALLALRMNGAELPPVHGGPLRAILPGRYATDSVKWVSKIRAISAPFDGFFAVHRYRLGSKTDLAGSSLGDLRVQCEISRPLTAQTVALGTPLEVTGAAWGGQGGVEKVEVSVDGGRRLSVADWVDPDREGCWRRWRHVWTPSQRGPRLLMARATDRAGQAQPLLSREELGVGFSLAGPDGIQYADNSVPIVPITVE